jgi:signal transduction histidine kinase
VLDHIGLVAAIEKEIVVFAKRYNIATSMARCELPIKLSPKRDIAIYRIFQEALTNIARHAGATSVFVNLNFDGDDVRMEIIDNGRGIDLDAQRRASIGLLSMSERAREIGGTLEIGLNPGGGTRLCLIAPREQGRSSET